MHCLSSTPEGPRKLIFIMTLEGICKIKNVFFLAVNYECFFCFLGPACGLKQPGVLWHLKTLQTDHPSHISDEFKFHEPGCEDVNYFLIPTHPTQVRHILTLFSAHWLLKLADRLSPLSWLQTKGRLLPDYSPHMRRYNW